MTTTTADRPELITPDEVIDVSGPDTLRFGSSRDRVSFATSQARRLDGEIPRLRMLDRVLFVLLLIAAVAVSAVVAVGVALVAAVLVVVGVVIRLTATLFRRIGPR